MRLQGHPRDVAHELLPLVEDTAWFFDTELLVLAERAGLRIHEVPVDWVDDPDSRVDIVATARDDLRGIARLGWALLRGRMPLAEVTERLGRTSRARAHRGRSAPRSPCSRWSGGSPRWPTPCCSGCSAGCWAPFWANAARLVVTPSPTPPPTGG